MGIIFMLLDTGQSDIMTLWHSQVWTRLDIRRFGHVCTFGQWCDARQRRFGLRVHQYPNLRMPKSANAQISECRHVRLSKSPDVAADFPDVALARRRNDGATSEGVRVH